VESRRNAGQPSTAVVLWFMLLIVFAPISLAHVVARLAAG
jgi:hypothetical protein